MATIDEALAKLQRSSFRAKFHLTEKDKQYVAEKGLNVKSDYPDHIKRIPSISWTVFCVVYAPKNESKNDGGQL